MAYNNHNQLPFWDFVRAFDPNHSNGAGVDHAGLEGQEHMNFFGPPPPHPPGPPGSHPPPPPPPPGAFPWGGPGGFWGRGGFGGFGGPGPYPHGGPGRHGHGGGPGRHGRRGRRDRDQDEQEGSRSRTASPSGAEHAEGDEQVRDGPSGDERERREHPHGGPRRGFGRRGGWGGGRGGCGHHGRRGPPPPPFGPGGPGGMGGFDLGGLFDALNNHPMAQQPWAQPWAQMLRQYAEQAGVAHRSAETLVPEDDNTFTPPIDVFSTETAYVLHIALPGAKKEDVGVNFDADKGMLNVAGIIYRQGDEEFLKTLSQSERKVGVFDRSVKMPPMGEEKEEVDGDAIVAKLEDGVLVVTVPKIEKEWTEVKKVDIN